MMEEDGPAPVAAAATATAGVGSGLAEQSSGEQQQQPKRAKRDGDGDGEEGDDAMQVDGPGPAGVPSTEAERKESAEERRRRELDAYFASAGEKPNAPDLAAFLDSPLQYSPQSPCVQGTVDAENNTALILAIKNVADTAFFILARGKDPAYINAQNSKGVTALNIASHRGYVAPVKELLERCRADVNIPNTSGSTSLIQASHFGHDEVVRLLLRHGANVDLPNHKGTTALMRAAQEGHRAVVEALLAQGADVNKRNHERMNALMLASQRGHDEIVKMLIKHGADIDCQTVQGSTALMLACKRQHEAVVRALLTAGAEIFIRDSRQRTARDTALKRNNKNIIAMLQAPAQVRLMQAEVRVERSHLLMKLYELCADNRAHLLGLVGNEPGAEAEGGEGAAVAQQTAAQKRQAVLAKAFDLPAPLFRLVVSFVPWPRTWETQLSLLHKRCNVDANEALRGALGIMDEVFTDLCISDARDQSKHLVRLARNPDLARRVREDPSIRMPAELLESVLKWNDAQSLLVRYEKGVTFTSFIADRAVKDAARLYSWCRFGGEDGGLHGEGDEEAAPAGMEDDGTGGDVGNDEDEDDDEGGNGNAGAAAMPPPPPAQQQAQTLAALPPGAHALLGMPGAQMNAHQMQQQAVQQLHQHLQQIGQHLQQMVQVAHLPNAPPGQPQPPQAPPPPQQEGGEETGNSDNEG